MIVYKVVRVTDGKLTSAIPRTGPYSTRRVACLRYSKSKVTRPKFGKLFAFDSLSHARMFSSNLPGTEVWEATAPEAERITIISSDGGKCLSRFKMFWLGIDLAEKETMTPPDGTVVCPELTLIRKRYSGN